MRLYFQSSIVLLISALKPYIRGINVRWIALTQPLFLFSSSFIEEEHDLWCVAIFFCKYFMRS